MKTFVSTFMTPFGPFALAVDAQGALAAAAFGGIRELGARIPRAELGEDSDDRAQTARAQLLEYFGGRRTRFDLALADAGTSFQRRLRAALCALPFGTVTSYGELARELGSSPRAVGRANGANPVCVVVPCHRVVGADGSPVGFAFGIELKQRLLAHERARRAAA